MSRRRFSSQISPQLLNEAAAGSEAHVQQLYDLVTATNCTINVVKVVLKHLEVDLVPNIATGQHRDSPYVENGRRALFSISTLDHVLEACRRNSELKEEVIQLLVEPDRIEGLCLWTNFLLHFGMSIPMDTRPGADFRQAYFCHAKFFCDLLNLDSVLLRPAIVTTPTFSDLVIRFWMTVGKKEENFLDFNTPQGCPIIHLFTKLVSEHEGRAVLFDAIADRRPDFADDFVEAVLDRFRLCASPHVPPSRAIATTDALVNTTTYLTPHFKFQFAAAGYLTVIAESLHTISVNIVNDGGIQPQDLVYGMRMLIRPLHKLFSLASSTIGGSYRLVRNWRDLVAGNYFTLLVRIMSHLPPTDNASADACMGILRFLGMYTLYPKVLDAVMSSRIPENPARRVLEHRIMGDEWNRFRLALADRARVRAALPEDGGVRRICDYPKCDYAQRILANRLPKQCSGCSSVIYCSPECQKADWDERHRRECAAAERQHARLISDLSWYSHTSTRPFQTTLLASIYAESYDSMLGDFFASSFCSPFFTLTSSLSNPEDSNSITTRNRPNLTEEEETLTKNTFHRRVVPIINFTTATSTTHGYTLTLEMLDRLSPDGERDREMGVDFSHAAFSAPPPSSRNRQGSDAAAGDGAGGPSYGGSRSTGAGWRERYSELLEYHVAMTKRPGKETDRAIVEGLFPHSVSENSTIVVVTVVLEKQISRTGGADKWAGVYSIIRFGHRLTSTSALTTSGRRRAS